MQFARNKEIYNLLLWNNPRNSIKKSLEAGKVWDMRWVLAFFGNTIPSGSKDMVSTPFLPIPYVTGLVKDLGLVGSC